MPEVGSWKDWILGPLRSRFGKAPEPWQARPPPQVETQFRREVTRLQPSASAPEIPPLSTEEIELLGLPKGYGQHIRPYELDDSDGSLRFLDWEEIGDKRLAIFRVENEHNPLGYHFSRLRYGEVQFAGRMTGICSRPDEDLKALRAFHARYGEPTKADLEEAETFFFKPEEPAPEPTS